MGQLKLPSQITGFLSFVADEVDSWDPEVQI